MVRYIYDLNAFRPFTDYITTKKNLFLLFFIQNFLLKISSLTFLHYFIGWPIVSALTMQFFSSFCFHFVVIVLFLLILYNSSMLVTRRILSLTTKFTIERSVRTLLGLGYAIFSPTIQNEKDDDVNDDISVCCVLCYMICIYVNFGRNSKCKYQTTIINNNNRIENWYWR